MSEQARLIANIERFGQLGGIMTGKEPCGDWVRYTDHVAEVTRLIDEIARVNRRVDEEAETDRITAERNAARAEVERLEAEVERLTVERDAAYISIESLRNALAEQDHELDMAREDVLRLTSERDAAQAEAERLRGETQRAVEAEREACASLFDGPVWAYDYRKIAARIRARRERWARDGATVRNEASTGWQPIETAPRDGTKVMIWLVRQKTIAWAQWKDADEYYGIPTNPARWEWQDGVLVSWVPDHPGAVSHWTTLEPPPTGGHDE